MCGVAHAWEALLCLGGSSRFRHGDQGREAGDRRLLTVNTGIHQDRQHRFIAPAAQNVFLPMGHTKHPVHRLVSQSCRCCGFIWHITKHPAWVFADKSLLKQPTTPSSEAGTRTVDRGRVQHHHRPAGSAAMRASRFQAGTEVQRDGDVLLPTIVQNLQGRFERHEWLLLIDLDPPGSSDTVLGHRAYFHSLHRIRTIRGPSSKWTKTLINEIG